MERVRGIFRGPRTLSIMPTFRCVSHCASCGTLSTPHDKTSLSLQAILTCIHEASRLNFANIVFTGGEPTLCWRNLLEAIKETRKLGLMTRLVTNAYWATTPNRALKKIQTLKDAGLDEINFSTGDEHAKFVPTPHIMNAIIASLASGFKPAVMIEDRSERIITKEDILSCPEIKKFISRDQYCLALADNPWMPLDPFEVVHYRSSVTANHDNLDSFIGCDPILQSLTILSDGNISTCCGFGTRLIPELVVSNINEPDFLAAAIENTENDFMKLWLRYEGPMKILAWAARKNPAIRWEDMYAHHCQACLRIYKDATVKQTIKENYQEKIGQIISSAWMEEVFIPKSFKRQTL